MAVAIEDTAVGSAILQADRFPYHGIVDGDVCCQQNFMGCVHIIGKPHKLTKVADMIDAVHQFCSFITVAECAEAVAIFCKAMLMIKFSICIVAVNKLAIVCAATVVYFIYLSIAEDRISLYCLAIVDVLSPDICLLFALQEISNLSGSELCC